MAEENGRRSKVKEVLARHTDLEQSQNKAQGALLSVLALTQVTELKILLDVGWRHKLYHFVLALLIGSIALQIIVGIIVIYIGHVRYQSQTKKKSFCRRFLNCFICKCHPICCKKSDERKRAPSYISVPIGVGAPETRTDTLELTASQYFTATDEESEAAGCCEWSILKKDPPTDNSNSVERNRLSFEQAKVKLNNAVTNVLKLTTGVERLESDSRKIPKDPEVEKELESMAENLMAAKRDKEQADSEVQFADSRLKQAILLADEMDEKEEMATFKKIRWWQQLALYMLYFITLMNVFVTAIGISTHN